MALGVGVPIPTIATAGIRLVPDLTGFGGLVRAGGIDQATVGAGGAASAIAAAGAAAVAFGAASVAAATKASTAFVNFEDSLIKIQTLTGTSAQQTEEWGDAILELAPAVGRGPQELADALFFVASAGVEGQAAFDTLEASARGAALGLGTTEQVADAVTSAIGAYGLEALSASEATDILAATVDRGKVEADALAGSIGRVVPIAAAAGVEFNEVGAAVAALSRTGLDADEATTALRQLLNNLINPSRESADALASVGLEASEVRDLLREDLLGTLDLLRDRFDGNTEGLFNLIPNIRAVTGFLSLMGENADGTRQIFDDLADSAGFVDERFAILAQSNAFRRDQAIAAIESAFIGEGSESADAITGLLETAAEVIPRILPDVVEIGETILEVAESVTGLAGNILDARDAWREFKDEVIEEVPGAGEGPGGSNSGLAGIVDFFTSSLPRQGGILFDNTIGKIIEFREAVAALNEAGIPLAQPLGFSLFDFSGDVAAQIDAFNRFQVLGGPTAPEPPKLDDFRFDDWSEMEEIVGRVSEKTSNYGGIIAGLTTPDGQIVAWEQVDTLIQSAIDETGNYSSAILALNQPGFAAAEAVGSFNEQLAAAKEGGITDDERAALIRPFLEVQARVDELDPAEALVFRDTITEAWELLGGETEGLFGEGGVIPLAIDDFGNTVATIGGIVVDNSDGWGTEFGNTMAGEIETGLAIVKSRLGIESPSSVWANEVGRPIAQGVAAGFRAGIPDILAAFGELPTAAQYATGGPLGGDTIIINNPREESIGSGIQRAAANRRVAVS